MGYLSLEVRDKKIKLLEDYDPTTFRTILTLALASNEKGELKKRGNPLTDIEISSMMTDRNGRNYYRNLLIKDGVLVGQKNNRRLNSDIISKGKDLDCENIRVNMKTLSNILSMDCDLLILGTVMKLYNLTLHSEADGVICVNGKYSAKGITRGTILTKNNIYTLLKFSLLYEEKYGAYIFKKDNGKLKVNLDLLLGDICKTTNPQGLYRFLSKEGEVIYVGKSIDVVRRIKSHNHLSQECYEKTKVIEWIPIANDSDLNVYEMYYINLYKPIFNKKDIGKYHLSIELPMMTWQKLEGI